jgi:RNA polymerase sigma-70 factor, ECF subfamily
MGCAVTADAILNKKVYDSPEELDLIGRAKQGDHLAFASLDKLHRPQACAVITRIVKDSDTAEWLANDVMIKAWLHLSTFREQSKFSTWIMRIAINEGRMHLRSGKRRQKEVLLGDLPKSDHDSLYAEHWMGVKDSAMEGLADREIVELAFQRVPKQFHEILRLRLFEEWSLEEIRVKMSVSLPAVKARVHRGRVILMEQIEYYRSKRSTRRNGGFQPAFYR